MILEKGFVLALLLCLPWWTAATPGFVGNHETQNAAIHVNDPVGFVVATLIAFDVNDASYTGPASADVSLSGSSLFQLTVQGYSVHLEVATTLSVGQHTGITARLMHEGTEVDSIGFSITVLAVNSAPFFTSSHYAAPVLENENLGEIILSVTATDTNQDDFVYAISGSGAMFPFTIKPETGEISLVQTLDFDAGTSGQDYTFTVEAREIGTSPLTGTTTVLVAVINVNDNAPTLPADVVLYKYMVVENSAAAGLTTSDPAGITNIEATDGDTGVFGRVTYSLTGPGVGTLFSVSSTGQLSTLTSLNREASASYHLTLIATDGGSPPLSDNTELVVNVVDINDNDPMFGVDAYVVTLDETEDHPNFVTFHATDADATSPNNQVTYPEITRTVTSGSNPFTLNPNTGAVSVLSTGLNHTIDTSYVLRITARDGGTPSREKYASLSVTVRAQNEHGPVFQGAPYSVTVMESLAVNSEIGVTARATDPVESHAIQYTIDHAVRDGDHFDINEQTGVITLAGPLDADPPTGHSRFTFFVVAEDVPPSGTRLSASAQVVVDVTDVNDNAPVITSPDHSPFEKDIYEEVASLGEVLVVVATDIDGNSDGSSVVYSVTPTTYFEVGTTTGSLRQTEQFDRETLAKDLHAVTVTACDQGSNPRCTWTEIDITVLDYNDNAPVMAAPLTSTVTVSECFTGAMELHTVNATDSNDIGDNAEVAYRFVSGNDGRVNLNTVTGVLSLGAVSLDYEGDTSHTYTIGAYDNPGGIPSLDAADQFVLTLTVADCNDNPPMFSMLDYSVIINESTSASSSPITIFSGVSTTDNDATSSNKAVTYSLADGPSSTLNWLDIDRSTGNILIRTGQTPDRENALLLIDSSSGTGVLTFEIEAINTASSSPIISLSATALVTVRINDVNDNNPVISPTSGPKTLRVLETTPVDTILSVITATDEDFGTNAHIRYEITNGNDAGKFAINADNGRLTLAQPLDHEGGDTSFMLQVTASNDLATGASPDTTTIDITVVGSNEHAPVFAQDHYHESIFEYDNLLGVGNPTSVITVVATDRDNDMIEYSITGGNNDGIFDIPILISGSVEIVKPEIVDYETTKSFSLIVTATDVLLPTNLRRTNTTFLNITVKDVNDNTPRFSSTTYYGSVSEEQPSGTSVTLTSAILASDPDENGNDPLTFDATSTASPFLAFGLSSDGAVVTTTTPIDRETQGDMFTFEIKVTDDAGHSTTANVNIVVEDINDNPPVIQQTSSQLFTTIPENHPVGSVIAVIRAQDKDDGINANYTVSLSGGAGFFEVDHRTGVVTLVASLQPLEPPKMFDLTAYARDTGGLESSVVFTVNLTYSNDHMPMFDPPLYSGSIAECAANGSRFLLPVTLSATDGDSNAVVSYYVVPGPNGGFFRVEPRPGEVAEILVYGEGIFDREIIDSFTFNVAATDNTLGSDDDFAPVSVTITDCNDNCPIFTQDFYEVDVFENTVADATVIQVHTQDADIGTNAEVRYRLRSVDPPELFGVFRVDEVTGGVVTKQEITSDLTGSSSCAIISSNNVSMQIEATDRGANPCSNEITLFIRLLDRNFDAPSFEPSNFYNFTAVENVNNTRVGTVLATDVCDVNSKVSYIIGEGTDASSFDIDENLGHISIVSPLDREGNSLLVILLEAADDGTDPGPRTGYASVSIHVLDVNDNPPYLKQDTFFVSKPEGTPSGTILASLMATDSDLGENSTLTYRILSGNTLVFNIDSESGELTTIVELDREEMATHVVEMLVEDGGSPRLNATATLNLVVVDVNDNPPVWTAGNGTTFTFNESDTAFPRVVVDLDAEDRDAGLNNQLVYFFVGGIQDQGPFHIDRENGTLFINGPLDYERITKHSLIIVAADRLGMEDTQTLQAMTTIVINVNDINDEEPYFTECPPPPTIPEDLAQGSMVKDELVSIVDDLDTVENPFFFYMVDEEMRQYVECNKMFCINSTTGEISLRGNIDYEVQTAHVVYVLVTDMQSLSPSEAYVSPPIDLCRTIAAQKSNITLVTINIQDRNDNQPIFVSDSLLAAVAEETEFDTTVTILQATDADSNANYSTVYFEILSVNPPYVVDRETGVIVTAGIFRGRSGEIDQYTVRAYDNKGNAPSHSSTAILSIQIFKETEQVLIVLDRPKDDAEDCTEELRLVIANVTDNIIDITKVRVHQDDGGATVDTAQSDVIFFALDRSTGLVVEPDEIIKIIDQNYADVEHVFKMCNVLFITTPSDRTGSSGANVAVSASIGAVMGILGAIILLLLCCLLCVCVLERRKNRKLKLKQSKSHHASSQLSQLSQVDYAAVNNPIWIAPYDQWEEASTTTAANSSTHLERDNLLYESQELTIEMFQDDADEALSRVSSYGNMDPPDTSTPGARESAFSYDDELLAEIVGGTKKSRSGGRRGGYSDEENLLAEVVGSKKGFSSETSFI